MIKTLVITTVEILVGAVTTFVILALAFWPAWH